MSETIAQPASASSAGQVEIAADTVSTNAETLLPVCRIYGHERWKGSGRCKWCGSHRDAARASG